MYPDAEDIADNLNDEQIDVLFNRRVSALIYAQLRQKQLVLEHGLLTALGVEVKAVIRHRERVRSIVYTALLIMAASSIGFALAGSFGA